MYGQTSGAAGQALRQMEQAYPTALAFLRAAEEAGRVGTDVRTHGGRLVQVGGGGVGRYARNAVVQGAAAELFKAWAAAVRNGLGRGRIVLCLHDELLLHVPAEESDDAVRLLTSALESTSGHWASGSGVRFVAEVAVVQRWSEAKD
jgi:DNA polymerase-1